MSLNSEFVRKFACRVCLDTEYSCGISLDSEGGTGLLQLYEFCFGLTIIPNGNPGKVCGICIAKMEEFAKFKNLAHKSEKLWKSNSYGDIASLSEEIWNNEIKQEKLNIPSYEHTNDMEKTDTKEDENKIDDSVSECKDVQYIQQENNKLIFNNESYFIKDEERLLTNFTDNGNFNCDVIVKKYDKRTRRKKKTPRICKPIIDAPTYFCGLCEVTSPDANQDKQHLTEHSANNDLNCRLCNFVGRDFADMVTHRYEHHSKKYRINLDCHLCGKKYLAKLALQFHYRSVHLEKKGGLCTHCGKQFGTYTMWRDHEKLHVTENFKCELCGRKFLFHHALKTHMINHSEVKGYVCDICGKGFKRNSNLKLHLQTAHDSNKVTCSHCSGTYKNQKSLKAHMQRVTKEKTFQCEVCSKYFDTQNMLRRHMVWHRDERPFICNVCGLSYKSTSQLNIHMRKHTGVMPFKCSQCTKSYPTSNQLREHVSNHSGERRYKCPYCPKSFHHKKLMVKHCSKRHSDIEDADEKGKKEEMKER